MTTLASPTEAPPTPSLWQRVRNRVLPGMFKASGARAMPPRLLELYSAEGCPACRRVRRTLTELDLDFVHRSCPRGESETRRTLAARGGKVQLPYLVDPNTGTELYESRDIVTYLQRTYGAPRVEPTDAPEPCAAIAQTWRGSLPL